MYCPPHLMCVPTLPRRKWLVKLSNFQCLTTDTGFISTKRFFVFQPNFDIFAEIYQKKMLKIHVAVRQHTYSEFLGLITNHATDAIKAVNVVNMKFSKLKKNNVRNTNKTWQLKQDSQSKCSNCPHRCTELGSRTKKFCGNKTSTTKSSHCWFYSVLLWFVAEQGEHAAGDAGRRPCKRFCIQRQWNWSDIVVIRAIIGWSWVWVR